MTPRYAFSLVISLSLAVVMRQAAAEDSAKKPPALFSIDISGGDLQFLTSAAEQGLLQANLAALAATHAKSVEVMEFGQVLTNQHAAQNEHIKLLALKKGLSLPSGLNPKQKAVADKLAKQRGLKFDKAYLEEVIRDEESYVALFEQATRSNDPDVRAFAAASLPDIKQQLALVRTMAGVGPRSSGSAVQFRASAAPSSGKN
jgi:putative membrane protein